MLAYLANTLAFSNMPRYVGLCLAIFKTHLHLANWAPSFLYWAHLSARPSKPETWNDFGLVFMLNVPVNSFGHVETVSSPNHFFLGKLDKAVNQYFVHILLLVTDNNPSKFLNEGKENDCKNIS